MKERIQKLQARIAALDARKAQLETSADKSEDVQELRSIHNEINSINQQIAELRATVDELRSTVVTVKTDVDDDDDDEEDDNGDETEMAAAPKRGVTPMKNGERRGIVPPTGKLNVLGTYGGEPSVTPSAAQTQTGEQRSLESVLLIRDTSEMRGELFKHPVYRSAFLKRLQRKPLDEMEQRAITTADDTGGAAVATTTYDLIVRKLRQTSALFPLIRSTFIPGNVKLPVASALVAAAWTAEAAPNDSDDDTVSAVNLTGYTLSKFASISIQARAMTIDQFETYIVDQLGMQLSIAIENVIVNGVGATGVTKTPLGVLPGVTWDTTNSATYAKTGLVYDDMVNARALLRSVYRPFAYWVLNSQMEAQIMKIKSTTGFPIFSQDPQNGFAPKILNMPYILNDYMPDDTLGLFCPQWYYMNFSQQPVIEASTEAGFTTSSILYRGMLVADGAPALSEAFVKITKAAA